MRATGVARSNDYRPNRFHLPSLPRIRTNSLPFFEGSSRGVQAMEIHDWKSQRAEQLSVAQGSSNSASLAIPLSDGVKIESVPRAGCSEQATVRKRVLSEAQT